MILNKFGIYTVCCLGLLPAGIAAEDTTTTSKIGDVASAWNDLPGTDGKRHSLSDLADVDVVVVCFTCNTCPYSVDYEDRIIAFQKQFLTEDAGVRLIAINSNAVAADSLDRMKDRATQKSFNFAYLRDDDQQVARAYGAIYTPEFYVLNKERRIVYRGAMDDSTDAGKVKSKHVELAVAAALKNEMPQTSQTGARGCTIRFPGKRR
jgi:peroxiredoxin